VTVTGSVMAMEGSGDGGVTGDGDGYRSVGSGTYAYLWRLCYTPPTSRCTGEYFGPSVVSPPVFQAYILGGGVRDAFASAVLAGWIRFDVTGWGAQRLHVCGPWPESLAVLDLRYWADPLACDKRPRPSTRALGRAWGWSESKARRFIGRQGSWADPFHVIAALDLHAPFRAVVLAVHVTQQRRSGDAPATHKTTEQAGLYDASDAPVTHQRRTSDAAPKGDTRAFTSPTPTPLPLDPSMVSAEVGRSVSSTDTRQPGETGAESGPALASQGQPGEAQGHKPTPAGHGGPDGLGATLLLPDPPALGAVAGDPTKPTAATRRAEVKALAQAHWDHLRTHWPGLDERVAPNDLRELSRAIKADGATLDELNGVADWIFSGRSGECSWAFENRDGTKRRSPLARPSSYCRAANFGRYRDGLSVEAPPTKGTEHHAELAARRYDYDAQPSMTPEEMWETLVRHGQSDLGELCRLTGLTAPPAGVEAAKK